LLLQGVLAPLVAFARVGGGEHYSSGRSSSGGGSGGDAGWILDLLFWLVIQQPVIGIPLLIILVIGAAFYFRQQGGDGSTRRALDQAEAQRRTTVSASAVTQWVTALKLKDPSFDLLPFFDRSKKLFLELQNAWAARNLEPVRRHLSDATYQRLSTQLKLMDLQGVRDAIADPQVLDLQIIGLEQNASFETLHIRVKASLRDTDVPSSFSDDQARAAAMKKPAEQFTEVWSFLRKPGTQTKVDDDGFQGKCPNCGAGFAGGAANRCEFCGAIVNSGNYDWVVAEITQASEFSNSDERAEGLERVRKTDPALSTEMLEDRASLIFWRWVEAQVTADPGKIVKLARADFAQTMIDEAAKLKAEGKRRWYLECAVGAVNTRMLSADAPDDLASVEIRWSAKIGVGPVGQKPPSLPTQPQRWVMILQRNGAAKTLTDTGVSSNRCPSCGAPLTDNGQPTCEYCGTVLSQGELDWVVRDFGGWEWWKTNYARAGLGYRPTPDQKRVPDKDERERMVYVMAAMAMADGVVDASERKLLKLASDRWGVPWANVELALNAGPGLFEKLMARGSAEAEEFLQQLVDMAMIDGKIDSRERKMLASAATHLGISHKLEPMITAAKK
jgi:tellurite resistance protein